MANIKANEKRHIQDEKRNLLNHMQMSALKSKGIITKNKANRMKSRLSLYVAGKSNRTKIEKKPAAKTAAAKKTDKKTSSAKTTAKKAAKK